MKTMFKPGRRVEYNSEVYVVKGVEGPNVIVTRVGSSARLTLPKRNCRVLLSESRTDSIDREGQSLRG